MISKEEVEHIAKLARLELTEKEIEKMQKDLSEVFDYFELLKKAPKVKGDYSNILKNVGMSNLSATRKDEMKKSDLAEEIIKASPDKKDNYIRVKSIL